MKIKIADLSILHRVYLSFAVLIGVLIAGSMLNYSSQNQLNSALVSVTEEAAPIVLLANKLEVSLLSTNSNNGVAPTRCATPQRNQHGKSHWFHGV